MADSWKAKTVKKCKRKLHYSMICCSKIKRAVQESLQLRTREPLQVWDKDQRLLAEPKAVGRVFSECLSTLGGDPLYEVNEE